MPERNAETARDLIKNVKEKLRGLIAFIYITLGLNFFIGLYYVANLFQATEALGDLRILLGGILLLLIYATPLVFLFIAALELQKLRIRGLAMNGAFMAFLVAGLFILSSVVMILSMLKASRLEIKIPAVSYFNLLFYGVGLLSNLIVGFWLLEMVTRSSTKEAFELKNLARRGNRRPF
jgi:hypothetical protein